VLATRKPFGVVARMTFVACCVAFLVGCGAANGPLRSAYASNGPVSAASGAPSSGAMTSTPTSSSAEARCLGLDRPDMLPMPSGTTLAAAFQTTPDRIPAFRDTLAATIGIPTTTPVPVSTAGATSSISTSAAVVTVCYFDGDFGRPRGNPPGSVQDISRMVVVIDASGIPTIVAMGFRESLPTTAP
jgi:hypothetical protein